MQLFNASVITTLFNTLETLHHMVDGGRRLDTFLNKCMHKMLNIKWTRKISYDEIWKITNQKSKRCYALSDLVTLDKFVGWRNQDWQKLQ